MKLLGRDTGELRLPMTPLDAGQRGEAAQDADELRPALGRTDATSAYQPASNMPRSAIIRSDLAGLYCGKRFSQSPQRANFSLALQFKAKVPHRGDRDGASRIAGDCAALAFSAAGNFTARYRSNRP